MEPAADMVIVQAFFPEPPTADPTAIHRSARPRRAYLDPPNDNGIEERQYRPQRDIER